MIIFILVLQLVTFVGLVYAFRRFLNKQLTGEVSRLKKLQEEYLTRDEELRKELDEAKRTKEAEINDAKAQAQEIIINAKKEAADMIENARFEAKAQAEAIVRSAEEEMSKRNRQIDAEVKEKVRKLFDVIVSHLFTDDEFYDFRQGLIKSALSAVPDETTQSVSVESVEVVVSEELSGINRELLHGVVKRHWGESVKIEFLINENIGEGVLLRAGGVEVDGTLKNRVNHIINRLDQKSLVS